MKSERKAVLLAKTENIEMDLFSSEESCMVIPTQKKKEVYSFVKRHLEHPLVPDSEEEPELEVEIVRRQEAKPKTEAPPKEEVKHCPSIPGFIEHVEIEMEVFPPLRQIKSDDPSNVTPLSPNKVSCLKWKRLPPQRTGLVVKDVICLPRGHYLAQLERHVIPRGKERAALAAMGMTARITIDCGWSANQMQSRLALLFWGRFVKRTGQRFSFTYLQCVQGSRVLLVPDCPAEGWTGEQVIRMSGHGALYILSHQDYPQAESESTASETPVVSRKEFYLEVITESWMDEDDQPERQTQPQAGRTTEGFKLDLDTIMRLFRQKNMKRDAQTHIHVRRGELLHSALMVVRRPDFCFRTTPIISFTGEETDGHEGPLREFFRLTLLELQESSVFEGHQGRLFLNYDLAALEDRKYYHAGVLIGWSLAQGGPGPRCLHPALYQLMCGQNPSLEDFSPSDVVDAEAQIRLQQLHRCSHVELLSPTLCDWVSSCGIPEIYSAHSDEIPAIYSRLVKHYIYQRVASMISQFKEGLNSCGGLWEMVQSNWEAFVPVMTSTQQQPLTLEEFRQLFTVCYSRPDGQLRAAEEATAGHWETVLNLVNNGQADFSFEDLLAFITGADHLPPLGFPRLISLSFYSRVDENIKTETKTIKLLQACKCTTISSVELQDLQIQDGSMSGVHLPCASTCTLQLFLPRGTTEAADLLVLLSRSVHEALGFTHFQTEGNGEDSTGEA